MRGHSAWFLQKACLLTGRGRPSQDPRRTDLGSKSGDHSSVTCSSRTPTQLYAQFWKFVQISTSDRTLAKSKEKKRDRMDPPQVGFAQSTFSALTRSYTCPHVDASTPTPTPRPTGAARPADRPARHTDARTSPHTSDPPSPPHCIQHARIRYSTHTHFHACQRLNRTAHRHTGGMWGALELRSGRLVGPSRLEVALPVV